MPYQVKQLLEGKGYPVCVKKDDEVAMALAIMIEHDYSQLPVLDIQEDFELPNGMITYEGILRGLRNFKLQINELKVRDVMSDAKIYTVADDLFDILDTLKNTNAVLIMSDVHPQLVGIVTSYDTTEYFRNRTEDLMRVEDVEVTVKDIIREAYLSENGDLDEENLTRGIKLVSHRGKSEKPKTFDELSMAEYINLLTLPATWDFFNSIFNLPRESVGELLHGVREIRNSLAHFRGDLTPEQRDQLKFGVEWLARCQEEYQSRKQREETARIREMLKDVKTGEEETDSSLKDLARSTEASYAEFTVTEAAVGGGRYAALADWLQSQPGRIDQTQLTFSEIEEIIGADLPSSARNHRAWWANDSVSHSQSQLWLDAGWRTTYINLSEGRVTFSRIKERERAYISFFSKLFDEL
jgi:CBS domain-containing protein